MANITKEPLLDLSVDRFIADIIIDDKQYGLLEIDNLSILQRQKLEEKSLSLTGIENIKTAKDEERHNNTLLEMLCLIIPDASRALLSKLSINKKLQVINAYLEVSGLLKKKVKQLAKGPRAKKKARR